MIITSLDLWDISIEWGERGFSHLPTPQLAIKDIHWECIVVRHFANSLTILLVPRIDWLDTIHHNNDTQNIISDLHIWTLFLQHIPTNFVARNETSQRMLNYTYISSFPARLELEKPIKLSIWPLCHTHGYNDRNMGTTKFTMYYPTRINQVQSWKLSHTFPIQRPPSNISIRHM